MFSGWKGGSKTGPDCSWRRAIDLIECEASIINFQPRRTFSFRVKGSTSEPTGPKTSLALPLAPHFPALLFESVCVTVVLGNAPFYSLHPRTRASDWPRSQRLPECHHVAHIVDSFFHSLPTTIVLIWAETAGNYRDEIIPHSPHPRYANKSGDFAITTHLAVEVFNLHISMLAFQ